MTPCHQKAFTFLTPGRLLDGDLELVLVHTQPADARKRYCPAYFFEMRHVPTGERMGTLNLRIGYNENIHYGGHIGYEVAAPYRGHRYAARSVRLV